MKKILNEWGTPSGFRIGRCFFAKGYDAVSVREIIEKAGITKPTLYYYFGSKIGLLEILLHSRYEEMKDQIESAVYYCGFL